MAYIFAATIPTAKNTVLSVTIPRFAAPLRSAAPLRDFLCNHLRETENPLENFGSKE